MKFNVTTCQTKRLILRKLTLDDAEDMFEYSCQSKVVQFLTWESHASLEVTKTYITSILETYERGDSFDWAIEHKADKKMIGTCGLIQYHPEHKRATLGYALHPLYWGQELMAEAIAAVLPTIFQSLALIRLQAYVYNGNDRSARVLEKCGFTYEGTLRKYVIIKGDCKDVKVYSMTATEYLAHQAGHKTLNFGK